MAAETTADPTARDLLRIAVEYAEQARAVGERFDGEFGSLLRVADTFNGLARTAALIESTELEIRADDEWPESVQCQTCGHLQGLHMQQTGCLACDRRGGLCEKPPNTLSTFLAEQERERSGGTVNVRRLRPVNRGRFKLDGPTDAYPAVRREQAGTFGPPDVDATAEIPRVGFNVKCNGVDVSSGRRCQRERHDDNRHDFPQLVDATAEIPRATWSDERCETYGPNGGRCRSAKHGSHVDHYFPQPDDPDDIA